MKHRLLYWTIRFLSLVSGLVGNTGRQFMSRCIAELMKVIDRERYLVTIDNIRSSLDDVTETEIREIANESYRNFAVCFIELLATPFLSRTRITERFDFDNPEVFEEQARRNRGLVLVSAHLGNWEWAVQVTGYHMHRFILSIAKPQRNAYVDAFINQLRTSEWSGVVSMFNAARDIISALQKNGVIGMMIDQTADPVRDVFVNFFGRPAVTFEAPASLALRYNADIIVAVAIRQQDGRYHIRGIPVPHDDVTNDQAGIHELVQRCSSVLESIIRQYPGQWSWQHKRWKYNPQDFTKELPHAH